MRKTELQKKYITENYLICSDYALALSLGASKHAIRKLRQRLGLRRTKEQTQALEVKSEHRRGEAGTTNAYGELIRREYY